MDTTFRQAFLAALEGRNLTTQRVAAETGVSVHQLRKLKEGKSKSTNVDDAIKIARYFGATLDEFIGDPEIKKDAEIISLLRELEPTERQFLINAAKAQVAARRQTPSK